LSKRLPLAASLTFLVASVTVAAAHAANADVLSAVNGARQRGCYASAARGPLQSSPKLQRAAARLAGGATLRDALAAEGYSASEFSALHFTGALGDAKFAHTLTANYCRTLTNPKLREFGAERRGYELWVVLAALGAAPAAADGARVSRQILDLVNAARAAGRRCGAKYFAPVTPLALNDRLASAALGHSRDMAENGEFDHRGHDGSTPALRIERAGYGEHRIVGENIAVGAMTPLEVTEGWLLSPAHCENIMDGRFTQIGIAYAASRNTAAGMYWTQDFAAPR
jgi:uncharacterized protein YkwD